MKFVSDGCSPSARTRSIEHTVPSGRAFNSGGLLCCQKLLGWSLSVEPTLLRDTWRGTSNTEQGTSNTERDRLRVSEAQSTGQRNRFCYCLVGFKRHTHMCLQVFAKIIARTQFIVIIGHYQRVEWRWPNVITVL